MKILSYLSKEWALFGGIEMGKAVIYALSQSLFELSQFGKIMWMSGQVCPHFFSATRFS